MKIVAAPFMALSFLTVFPMPLFRGLGDGSLGWAVACFPLVGICLGALLAGTGYLLGFILPSQVVAALLLATLLMVTGAIHLDGLMDSFDGLFGGKSAERRLEIMKDSRVGSYGVAAGASLLLIEYSCLASLPLALLGQTLILALSVSRWAMAGTLWGMPPASSRGLAAWMKPQLRRRHMILATLAALAVAVASLQWFGVGMLVVAGLLTFAVGGMAGSRLGGVTGDLCGGIGQLVEAVVLVASVAWARSVVG